MALTQDNLAILDCSVITKVCVSNMRESMAGYTDIITKIRVDYSVTDITNVIVCQQMFQCKNFQYLYPNNVSCTT
jgi:hypothetical protein